MVKQSKKLSPNALFDSTEKLIAGYNLTANYGKEQAKSKGGTGRKVYLIGRPLKSGNVSLVRYAFHDGKRERESTGKVLRVEIDYTIKNSNKEIVRGERVVCDKIEAELTDTGADFTASTRGNVLLSDFLFGDKIVKTSQLDSVSRLMRSLSGHVKAYEDILVRDVNENWVKGFVNYLRNDAVRLSAKDESKVRKLSQNTQNKCLVVLSVALNKAMRKRMLRANPVMRLEHKERIKPKKNTRTFLEASELKKLFETECVGDAHGYDIKKAFLFCALVGLRWSDVRALRPCDLGNDENGVFLDIDMIKTSEDLNVYLGENALSLLPNVDDETKPFFKLPSNKTTNDYIKEWVKAAGVTKNVSFHTSRHTCATLLLSDGESIQNVSAQLGHKRIETTQIYAKLTNKARKKTANRMDNIANGILGKEEGHG